MPQNNSKIMKSWRSLGWVVSWQCHLCNECHLALHWVSRQCTHPSLPFTSIIQNPGNSAHFWFFRFQFRPFRPFRFFRPFRPFQFFRPFRFSHLRQTLRRPEKAGKGGTGRKGGTGGMGGIGGKGGIDHQISFTEQAGKIPAWSVDEIWWSISMENFTSASFSQRVVPTAPFNTWEKRIRLLKTDGMK